jgi:hypothetical protein
MTPQEREDLLREAVKRGQYAKLYHKLRSLRGNQWAASFGQIEEVLGRSLPKSSRLYRAWWGNDTKGSHTHANSWLLAGWETSQVNLAGETLVFVRK